MIIRYRKYPALAVGKKCKCPAHKRNSNVGYKRDCELNEPAFLPLKDIYFKEIIFPAKKNFHITGNGGSSCELTNQE